MLCASSEKKILRFKLPAGTSRGVLTEKLCWIIKIWDDHTPDCIGIGEASIIKTLSPDWSEDYEKNLNEILSNINHHVDNEFKDISSFPSIKFGCEMALIDFFNGGKQIYFDSDFTDGYKGITINGLIWMGEKQFMFDQIKTKLEAGFSCVKLKIGAIDFNEEIELLKYIRSQFSKEDVELRVDANGAFEESQALEKLKTLSDYDLHSIEQPIKAGNWNEMAKLCAATPLDIALDEELIGINDLDVQSRMLTVIKPQYIILKPSLLGGTITTNQWISLAGQKGIKWWITSALESNVGLNALAQYTFSTQNTKPQGLGTGQ
ncbi:MAG: O-succinylbenzoate synthase, partial [Arenicella sp.]